jgi:hypothetical protein
VTLLNFGRGPTLFYHGLKRKEKQNSLNLGNPLFFSLFFLHFFLSFFSGVGKEVRREWWILREDMRVHRGNYLLL